MKIHHIKIHINPQAQKADPQCSVRGHQQLKAVFDELRQLSLKHSIPKNSQTQAIGSQGFLPASDLMIREMQVASAIRLDVLELVQDFLKSDQSYETLIQVGDKLTKIGMLSYYKNT